MRRFGSFFAALLLLLGLARTAPAATDPGTEGSLRADALTLATAYVRHKLPDLALRTIDRALVDAGTSPGALALHLEKAKLLRIQRRFDEALSAARAGLALPLSEAESASLRLEEATVLARLRKSDDALAALEKCWLHAQEAWVIDIAEKQFLLLLRSEPPEVMIERIRGVGAAPARTLRLEGLVRHAAGDTAGCIHAWRERLKLEPWDDEIFQQLALLMRDADQLADLAGLAELRWRTLQSSPMQSSALLDLLKIYVDLGGMDERVARWTATTNDLLSVLLLGEYLWSTGNAEAGETWDLEALKLDPDNIRVYERYVERLAGKNRFTELMNLHRTLPKRFRHSYIIGKAAGYLADDLENEARDLKGAEVFEAQRAADPEDRVSRHVLMKYYEQRSEKYSERLAVLGELVALQPGTVLYRQEFYRQLGALGRREEAIEAAREFMARVPLSAVDTIRDILQLQLELGRESEAGESLRAWLDRRPVRPIPGDLALVAYTSYRLKDLQSIERVRRIIRGTYRRPGEAVKYIMALGNTAFVFRDGAPALAAIDQARGLWTESSWQSHEINAIETLQRKLWTMTPGNKQD